MKNVSNKEQSQLDIAIENGRKAIEQAFNDHTEDIYLKKLQSDIEKLEMKEDKDLTTLLKLAGGNAIIEGLSDIVL